MFAEAAVCVQKVILQHEAAEAGEVVAGDAVISLSPPSQSSLMVRRRALRLASCGTLIEERVRHLLMVQLSTFTFQESMLGQIVESPC